MRRRSGAETPDPAAAAPEAQAPAGDAGTAGAAAATAEVTPPPSVSAPGADTPPDGSTPASAPPAPSTPGDVPGAAPAPGTAGATPADVVAPAADPDHPGFATRGRLRRRLRYLRRVRELGYRDLGGLVFDQHRFARPNEALVQTKVGALAQIDSEVRALERALDDKRAIAELREAGIAACPRCGAIHGSESRYCPTCGLALSGPTEMAAVHNPAPTTGPPAPAASAPPITGPPTAVPIAPVPVPPVTPQAAVAPSPAPAPPAVPSPASASASTSAPAAAAPPPATPALAPQDTIHLRPDAPEQPTTVLRASDVGGAPVTGGDPLTGPRPADRPDLKSGDPLAGRPGADPKTPEPEPRP